MKLTIPQKVLMFEVDERLRDLERRAQLGDKEAQEQLKREQWRSASPNVVDFESIKEIMFKMAKGSTQRAWISGERSWGDTGFSGQARKSRDALIQRINVGLRDIGSMARLAYNVEGTPRRRKTVLLVFLPSTMEWVHSVTGETMPMPTGLRLHWDNPSPDMTESIRTFYEQILELGSNPVERHAYYQDAMYAVQNWVYQHDVSASVDLFNQWAQAYLDKLQK